MNTKFRTIVLPLALAVAFATALIGQGSFTISLDAPQPGTFNNGPVGSSASLTNIVRTEALSITLSTMPTPPVPPTAQLLPRRIVLWLGPEATTPLVFPQGTVFLGFSGPLPAFPIFDGFTDPLAPTFGPPLTGTSNTLAYLVGANLFGPVFNFPLPTLVLQAVCEDSPGNGVLLSNAVRFNLVDPAVAGFAPTVTDLSPKTPTSLGILRPQGPEIGGNPVTLTGTNFLAQSNWIQFPPTVFFGTQASPFVAVVDNQTLVCIAPATAMPTMPPFTNACLVNVSLTNNALLSPTATPAVAPIQYLYRSGVFPSTTGFDVANGSPEGGTTRMVLGSGFLNGIRVEFTSVANPSLTTTLFDPPAVVGAGGLSVAFPTPVFCTGAVNVRVINCDDEFSNAQVFTYDELMPTLTSGLSTFTAPPALGGQTFIQVIDSGGPLMLTGTNYLAASSPLATASTVPAGSFYPTRVFIDGVQEPGVAASSATQINGTTRNVDQTGLFRPELGLKTLVVENPPCVRIGNAAPIQNPPCPPLTPPCTVLRQDALAPQVTTLFPAISSTSGCKNLRITGSNFFSRANGVLTQDFTTFANPMGVIQNIPPQALQVPAVAFGTRFAPRVTILSETELEVEVPAITSAVSMSVTVTVINPDLRSVSSASPFVYVPGLTDPTRLTSPMVATLDETALMAIASGAFLPGGPGANDAPALLLARNPSPFRDAAKDAVSGSLPSNTSYDFVFLFNTREAGPVPAPARYFNFNSIDLPATITLTAPGQARQLPIDPALPTPATNVVVPAGVPLRVIVKALGYRLDTNGRVLFTQSDNHPLFLQSHGDLKTDALMHLGGDAFFYEAFSSASGGANAGPFRVRVDRTLPPAGAGRGGRGGSFFPEGLVQLPGPNFGVSPGSLAGGNGSQPGNRFVLPSPRVTEGLGGVGTAPIGVQSGGGGGAGSVTNGAPGIGGTSPGGVAGLSFGNFTNGPVGMPLGTPADDRFVFGNSGADFALFRSQTALQSGMIYGGSGGGGGGGGLAIFVPAQACGGRGGNGGGALVLLADCVLTIGNQAILLADGEQGQLGVDVFPVYNASPTIPVNIPGAGGSGSGGTILGFAVSHICLERATSSVCPIPGPPPALGAGLPAISARGVMGGPELTSLGGVGSTPGGLGADGRLRFAIAANSPYVSDLATQVNQLLTQNVVRPLPPQLATLPATFFAFSTP